jgi:hypothetical protein|nr:MAG TPA: hypothetical protein [Caudoviricetes sp.]
MKYTPTQKQQIKDLLDNSVDYVVEPLFGENKPYYNTALARQYMERYRDLALEIKRSNSLTRLYDQDISKLDDKQLKETLKEYKADELRLQKQYIDTQQEIANTIKRVPDARYRLLLTNYYLNNISLTVLATTFQTSRFNTGCSFRAIKMAVVEALKQVCEVLQGEQ